MTSSVLALILALPGFAAEPSNPTVTADTDTITVTTTPPGATVSWNRKVIGVTPLTYKVGDYAFNARKISVFSKRLSQPVVLHIALDGFQPKDVSIAKELIWSSFNGRNRFAYYIIEFQNWDFKLDKISASPKVLTNEDILELWRAGFGDDLIIEKINSTATAFNLEIPDMVLLRDAGVSDAVIQAMMHKTNQQ